MASMPLSTLVMEAFSEEGPLSRWDVHFQPRAGQTEMARAVAETVDQGGALVVEAGTGVGKTFAYLVPALLSGERVLISTATKALQDQLFSRDLPGLAKALNLPVRMALLKGRGNYLCTYRLALARSEALLPDRQSVHMLAKVETWAQATRTGDLAEMPGLDERSSLLPWITSNRDNCLGSDCEHHKTCHVMAARREALAADVVVINHHLFFADLAVRESGMAELLPSVRVAIFDEAHQLNETGVQFLGRQLSSSQLIDLSRDLLVAGLSLARGQADWQGLSAQLELAARDLRLLLGAGDKAGKLAWTGNTPDGVDEAAWRDMLNTVQSAAESLLEALEAVLEVAPDFVRLSERVQEILVQLAAFGEPAPLGSVRWVDLGHWARLMQAPLDIAETVRTRMLGAPVSEAAGDELPAAPLAEEAAPWRDDDARPRSWIFTSATLGDDATLRWFTEPCGLADARVLQVQSPFNYSKQAVLFVPRDVVRPSDPQHTPQVAALSEKIVRALGGRTLVLTTTLRALRQIGDTLRQQLGDEPGLEVLVQGEGSKRELMDRFRAGDAHARRGCVLVASATFWEGFDVPGEALQAVIIDKLPFPPPNDPMVEARGKRLEALGRSPFNHYFLPEAVVALKQGAGRLIRRETDRGVLVVCDNRLITTGYGRRLMDALPPMARASSEPALLEGLRRLTKASTTGPISSDP